MEPAEFLFLANDLTAALQIPQPSPSRKPPSIAARVGTHARSRRPFCNHHRFDLLRTSTSAYPKRSPTSCCGHKQLKKAFDYIRDKLKI
jgi:hypothetical protein